MAVMAAYIGVGLIYRMAGDNSMLKKIIMICVSVCILSGCVPRISFTSATSVEHDLWDAIDSGILEAVKEAVENGADINKFHSRKYHERTYHNQKVSSPLMLALFDGRYEIAWYLLSCEPNVNCTDLERKMSLLQYCVENNPMFAEAVIDAGADVTYTDTKGMTALDYSTKCQYTLTSAEEMFELLMAHGAEPTQNTVNQLTEYFNYTKCGMLRIVANSKASQYMADTVAAAFKGEYTDVAPKDIDDITLYAIASFGTWDNLQLYRECIDTEKAGALLMSAILYSNTDVIVGLAQSYSGMTVQGTTALDYLCIAAATDNLETVSLVRELFGGDDTRAARVAIERHNDEILLYFLDDGLNPNSIPLVNPLLSEAGLLNNYSATEILLTYGATADDHALAIVCQHGYLDIAKLLVQHGADANGKVYCDDGSGGYSVLLQTIDAGQFECVRFLIENGADVYYEYAGRNAIEEAERCGSVNIYNYLLSQAS